MARRSAISVAAFALGAASLARIVADRGGIVCAGSLLLHRLARRAAGGSPALEESRLYARRGRRLEAHLGRRPDGGRVVVALPVGGAGSARTVPVGERRPWDDFERAAGLRGSAWGPCRSASAGL